jgi:hypothetical protein
MKFIRRYKKLFSSRNYVRPIITVIVIVAMTVIGVELIISSRALSSPYVSTEVTTGKLTSRAQELPVNGATSGQTVEFGNPLSHSPPISIADNCSKDASSQLTFWFASLPAGSTVNFPSKACYLVSISQALFTLQNTNDLTVNANGTTLKQTHYAGSNTWQPILSLASNTNLTINDLTILGPYSNSGEYNEGDYGVLLTNNNGVTLNKITITSVDGDGLGLYPGNGRGPAVNWNVTVDHSLIENIGYHAITPEASDGFTLENSVVTSGDIDAEVDYSCQPPAIQLSDCGTLSDPFIGDVNMTYRNNWFPNGLVLLDGMGCMPVGNWTIDNNNFGSAGMVIELSTTYTDTVQALDACGRYSGLTIDNNTSANTTLTPCCGGGSPYFIIQGWQNITIKGNHLVYQYSTGVGTPGFIDLCGDSKVAITNNDFYNMFSLLTTDVYGGPDCGGVPTSGGGNWPATTNLTFCGNTYWVPTDPKHQPACPHST